MTKFVTKPKILVVGDSSAIHTGFANVVRHICMEIYKTGNYDLKTVGWFHMQTDEIVPYEIIPTFRDAGNPMFVERDKYSAETFPKVVDEYKPDLVIAVGDSWMVEPIAKARNRNKFKLILYVPIDGMPIPKKWIGTFEEADVLVAYGEFGKNVIHQRKADLDIAVINHGVDLDVFRPLDEDTKTIVKKQFGGDDLFIIGCVARNQPRKNLERLFKTARLFLNEYSLCLDCGELTLTKVPECPSCRSQNIEAGEAKDDVRFYFHMALKDCGWDILELIERFELQGKIAYPKGLQIGRGVEAARLAEIMNAFDIFTLPTGGEGWGLPILEAMACGLPCLVTGYSALVDFARGATELIEVSEFISEPLTNIERAYVDLHDYAMKLDRMYYDDTEKFLRKWGRYLREHGVEADPTILTGKRFRDHLGKLARERALNYDWNKITKEWIGLINQVLDYTPGSIKERVSGTYATEEL